MTDLQLELTRLIGSKELTFGCIVYIPETKIYSRRGKEGFGRVHFANGFTGYMWVCLDNKNYIPGFNAKKRNVEIIGHPATISDLHRYFNSKNIEWEMYWSIIRHYNEQRDDFFSIDYDSSLDLLDQPESTLQAIINLIKEYEKDSMEAN